MGKYIITSKTNTFGKRDVNYNKPLYFEVQEGLSLKKITIESGDEIYLDAAKLPIKLQSYRMKGLVTIVEISETQYRNKLNAYNKVNKQPIINTETLVGGNDEDISDVKDELYEDNSIKVSNKSKKNQNS